VAVIGEVARGAETDVAASAANAREEVATAGVVAAVVTAVAVAVAVENVAGVAENVGAPIGAMTVADVGAVASAVAARAATKTRAGEPVFPLQAGFHTRMAESVRVFFLNWWKRRPEAKGTGMMDLDEFERSALAGGELPGALNGLPKALWLARAGRWDDAHELCQDLPGNGGAWLHAWLHRQEGDYGNACYWYARAGREATPRSASLVDEWREMLRAAG
jgi:hypothetical protein